MSLTTLAQGAEQLKFPLYELYCGIYDLLEVGGSITISPAELASLPPNLANYRVITVIDRRTGDLLFDLESPEAAEEVGASEGRESLGNFLPNQCRESLEAGKE